MVGAANLYVDELLQIPSISSSGCAQLLADVEYFGNVLSAMGFLRPANLVSVQKALSMPAEDLKRDGEVTSPKEGGAAAVLRTVAKMRGVVLSEDSRQ